MASLNHERKRKANATRRALVRQVEELQLRLGEAEDALGAIRNGEVDAIVVSGAAGEQVFTLKGADQPYRILIETMSEGTVTLLPDGTIAYSNSRFAEMVRTPLEQVIGSPFTLFLPPDQHTSFRSLLERSRKGRSKAEFMLRAANPEAGLKPSLAPADSTDAGANVPVQISTRPLDDESSAGCFLLVTDLTELKRAEAAVKAERQRLFAVLETMPAMVCLLTPDYHIPFANRAFRERFGGAEGRPCYEYCWGRTAPCDFCESYQVLKTGQPHQWEVTGPDGSRIEAHDFPFTDVDGSPLILEMDLDITEHRRAEEKVRDLNANLERRVAERTAALAAANRELESLAHSMAHDLRAPLRGLDGFSLALLEDYGPKLDEEGRKHLQRIRGAANRMGHLIDDMSALSKIARMDVNKRSVSLTDLAQAVASDLQNSQGEREVEFVIPPGIEVEGDTRLLQIVLEKLMENAWKFSAGRHPARIEFGTVGAPPVSALGGHEADPDGRVYFVRDNGVGFDMKYAGKLFGPFQRLHSDDKFAGTGMGLAMVERIIRKHGGKVWAEGAVGQGATFYFTLGTEATVYFTLGETGTGEWAVDSKQSAIGTAPARGRP